MNYVIFASGGNDSVALVEWAKERGLASVTVCHSNTGWASPAWPERIRIFSEYVRACGFDFTQIESVGFESLVLQRKGFPANRPKFCTYELKIKPACAWLDNADPDKEAICLLGIRREESRARAQWPEFISESPNHGGRDVWSPLVRVTEAERDDLIRRTPIEILAHRSRECSPCVNSNREDFRMLPVCDIEKVEKLEAVIGKPMFRTQRFRGAKGIREVLRWAWSDRGKYSAEPEDCGSGFCGD